MRHVPLVGYRKPDDQLFVLTGLKNSYSAKASDNQVICDVIAGAWGKKF